MSNTKIHVKVLFDSGVEKVFTIRPSPNETRDALIERVNKLFSTIQSVYTVPIHSHTSVTISKENSNRPTGKSGYIQIGNVLIDIAKTSTVEFVVIDDTSTDDNFEPKSKEIIEVFPANELKPIVH